MRFILTISGLRSGQVLLLSELKRKKFIFRSFWIFEWQIKDCGPVIYLSIQGMYSFVLSFQVVSVILVSLLFYLNSRVSLGEESCRDFHWDLK